MPPKLSAALYRAATKIQGVTVVPDMVDAAGGHGIAVSRVDKHGAIEGTTAVLSRSVVDHVKELPKK